VHYFPEHEEVEFTLESKREREKEREYCWSNFLWKTLSHLLNITEYKLAEVVAKSEKASLPLHIRITRECHCPGP
jgi:hypothetical protein